MASTTALTLCTFYSLEIVVQNRNKKQLRKGMQMSAETETAFRIGTTHFKLVVGISRRISRLPFPYRIERNTLFLQTKLILYPKSYSRARSRQFSISPHESQSCHSASTICWFYKHTESNRRTHTHTAAQQSNDTQKTRQCVPTALLVPTAPFGKQLLSNSLTLHKQQSYAMTNNFQRAQNAQRLHCIHSSIPFWTGFFGGVNV